MNAPTSPATDRLALERVSRTYGAGTREVHALRDVSLRVGPGEFVAVMGPSGSGKSTLLTIAGGMEMPSSGRALIDGVDLAGLSAAGLAKLRRERIGYIFQAFNLLPALTAAENVRLPLELDGVRRTSAHLRAVEQLEVIGLGDRLDHFPEDLSGGEQQRVAIARALVAGGRLVLADEPTGALDSANGELVMRTLRRACDGGASAVVVTHDAQLAAWADRVVFLRDGRVVDETDPLAGVDSLLAEARP
jgi:putative ABC transport system ATP-binding protein